MMKNYIFGKEVIWMYKKKNRGWSGIVAKVVPSEMGSDVQRGGEFPRWRFFFAFVTTRDWRV